MHHTQLAAQSQPRLALLRRPAVQAETGKSRSARYAAAADGLFTRPVKLTGSRAVGWPSNEVEEIVAATIAGVSDEEMRNLVARLMAARKTAH